MVVVVVFGFGLYILNTLDTHTTLQDIRNEKREIVFGYVCYSVS